MDTSCSKSKNNLILKNMLYFANPSQRFKKNKNTEINLIKNFLGSKQYILGNKLDNFEKNFAKFINAKYSIGVANATDGIEIILNSHGIGNSKNDQVITVSHTAPATISGIISAGAKPVLCDIRDNFLINEKQLNSLINKNTRAIIIVHIYGYAYDIGNIKKICKKKNLLLIEDCSQAHGAEIKGKKVGSIGDYGVFSFYPTKNLAGFGDGGIITTNHKKSSKKIRSLRNYGHNSKAVSMYNGRNSRLDTVQAIILNERLKKLNSDNHKRIFFASRYNLKLKNLPIKLPPYEKNLSNVFHLYVIRVNKIIRDKLIKYLKKNKIIVGIHYRTPNFLHPAFSKKIIYKNLRKSKKIADEIISLPIYPELKISEQSKVISTIKRFFNE